MCTYLHILSDKMDKNVRKLHAPLSVEADLGVKEVSKVN